MAVIPDLFEEEKSLVVPDLFPEPKKDLVIPNLFDAPETPESKAKDIFDAFNLGARDMWHKGKQYFTSALPNMVFRDIDTTQKIKVDKQEFVMDGMWIGTKEQAKRKNEGNYHLRKEFKKIYDNQETKYKKWTKANPELQPRKGWDKGVIETVKDNPNILKDPAYWGYVAAKSSAFTIGVLGTTVAVTALTKNPLAGLAAGVAVATPMQSQDLYEDLIDNGATEEQAAKLAVPIGTLIASVEVAGDLPLLRSISAPIRNMLTRQMGKNLAKLTMGQIAKKGLKTFGAVQIAETLEEVAQTAIQNATVKTINENRSLLEDIPETIVQTLIATTPFALVGGGAEVRTQITERIKGALPEELPTVPTKPIISKEIVAPEVPVEEVKPTPTVKAPVVKPLTSRIDELQVQVDKFVNKGERPPKDLIDNINVLKKELRQKPVEIAGVKIKELGKVEKPVEVKRATVEEIEISRKKYELEDISVDETRKWVDILKRAEKTKAEALYVAKAIKKKARVLTNDEFASLHLRSAEVEDLIDISQADIAKAVDTGNIKEQERHTVIMDGALSELEEITEALRFSNREAGRALNIVKMALKKEGEQYKLAKILQKAKVAKGEKLTSEETRKFGELSRKIEAYKKLETSLTAEIETLQEKLSKQDATTNFKKTTRTIRRKREQTTLKTERESLFKALNKLGYRANEVIGVTYESAKIISKLAINYFESGVKDIDAIVEKIQTRIPDLSNKDVYDSIGGRIKRTTKIVVNETKREIADLKTQARLLGEIEDAYNGIIAQLKKRRTPSAKVAKLQRKLKELKKKATQSVKDDETLRRILDKIDTAQYQLKTGLRTIKKTRLAESQDIQNTRQELSELRSLISTTDKIADLENQLETGDFKVPVKILRVVKNAKLIETQVKLSQLRREVRESIHRMKKRTKRELFVDIVTLPRTLMATADFSGVLRQGAWLTARHPLITGKIFVQSSKAFFSQNTADEIDNAIRKHEYQPIREKAGLFLASQDNIKFTEREEEFLSNLGDRIPVWGRIIKASNRNMSSHLNLLRVASFDHYLKLYPNATDEELTAWASYINVASGRGYLGAFNKVADELSVGFFSPRYSSSRIELPFEIFRHWRHPNVRKEIAKDIMAFVSITGTALLLAQLAGFKVSLDPEDSDFLKIKIGDTRIDLLAGLQQPMRVMILAMLKVLDTAGVSKMKRDIDLYDAVARFVRYKFAPAVSMPLELMQGKNAIGQETTILETFTNNITPMVLNEIIDTYKSNIVLGSILAPFILLGVSVGTYEKRRKRKRFKL